ncbi:hypothetical protein [Kibdelosporangium aridum]|uniref:hypothetical protein n=1 Tax=Kibdelosporangium aridum TaxID=2030 RepID=UPI000523FC4D
MPMTQGPNSWREASARRLLTRLRQRTALNEGVGILQAWNLCQQQEARDRLLSEHGRAGQDAEADRMIAFVDATANRRADPDAHWD